MRKNLGLKLDDQQLRISIGLPLGANICVAHTCHCGKRVERDGLHGLSCTKSAGRFPRHGTLNSLIRQTLGSLDLRSMLEPRGLYRREQDVSAKTFRQKNSRRFGKKTRDVSAKFSCRNVPYYLGPVLSWFSFWFSTNWLGPVCGIPVCRILELKKNDKNINVGKMEGIKRASDRSPFPLVVKGHLA